MTTTHPPVQPRPFGRPFHESVKAHTGAEIGVGVCLIVAGVLALWAPFVTGLTIIVILGVLLLASGLAELGLAFQLKAFGQGIAILLMAALMLIVGFTMVIRPSGAIAPMTLLLAFYLILAGIIELFEASSLRPLPGWGWMAASGVISIFLGIVLWRQFPLSGRWAIGTIVGIKLLVSGITLVAVGVLARGLVDDEARIARGMRQ